MWWTLQGQRVQIISSERDQLASILVLVQFQKASPSVKTCRCQGFWGHPRRIYFLLNSGGKVVTNRFITVGGAEKKDPRVDEDAEDLHWIRVGEADISPSNLKAPPLWVRRNCSFNTANCQVEIILDVDVDQLLTGYRWNSHARVRRQFRRFLAVMFMRIFEVCKT